MNYKIIKRKYFFTLISICVLSNVYAQDKNLSVEIKCTGSGASVTEAKQFALRDALEQAFGAFITTNTEILNQQVVKDELSSISNGNIQDYKILNEIQLGNGEWMVTINATVSVNKLLSFAQSNGMEISFNGGIFALNVQQKKLNEQGEIKAIENMINFLNSISKEVFDYTIKTDEPESVDGKQNIWKIPLQIEVLANKNFQQIPNLMRATLMGLSLTDKEVKEFNDRKVNYFVVNILQADSRDFDVFYLRNEKSIQLISRFILNFTKHITNFVIDDGIKINKFSDFRNTRIMEDNFRVAAINVVNANSINDVSLFAIDNENIYKLYTSLRGKTYNSYYEKYKPEHIPFDIGYGCANEICIGCNCMGDIQKLDKGLILQFNQISRNGRTILFEVLDYKSTDEIMLIKSYKIKKM